MEKNCIKDGKRVSFEILDVYGSNKERHKINQIYLI